MTKHVPLNEVDSFGGFDVVSNWDPKRMAKKIATEIRKNQERKVMTQDYGWENGIVYFNKRLASGGAQRERTSWFEDSHLFIRL